MLPDTIRLSMTPLLLPIIILLFQLKTLHFFREEIAFLFQEDKRNIQQKKFLTILNQKILNIYKKLIENQNQL